MSKRSRKKAGKHSSKKVKTNFALARHTCLAAAISLAIGEMGLAAEDYTLDEIIVTATKRAVNLQNMGQSVRAFTAVQIEERGYLDLEDYAKGLPSLSYVGMQPGANDVIFRGVSTGWSYGDVQTDSTVAMYIDEVPVTTKTFQVDFRLIDIERVEALPGPQGTLFGSSSQTGTLRIVTNKPNTNTDKVSGQIDVEAGSTKGGGTSYQYSGHVNFPIGDKFAVRLVGYVIEEGGYVDIVAATALGSTDTNADQVAKDQNEISIEGARVQALWEINPDWSVIAGFSFQNQDNNGTAWSSPALGDFKIVRFFDDFKTDDWRTASLVIEGDLGFAEVVSATTYFDRYNTYEFDNMVYDHFKTAAYAPTWCGVFCDVEYASDGTNINTNDNERFSQEIRLTSAGDSRFQWMVGGFYEKNDNLWQARAVVPGLSDLPIYDAANVKAAAIIADGYFTEFPVIRSDFFYSQDDTRKIEQLAFFGEVNYDFTDQLTVTAGARWFQFEREGSIKIGNPFSTPPAGAEPENGLTVIDPADSTDQVFKLGVQYAVDDDKMIYALWSQGFRLGGTNAIRSGGNYIPPEYDADTMDNYEAGFKTEWLDNRLQVNTSLFFMKWSDYQINHRPPFAWWASGIINGGGAESKGVEFSVAYQASPNLMIDASAYWGRAEFTEETISPVLGWTGEFDLLVPGNVNMPMSPEEKYSFSLIYDLPEINFAGGSQPWIAFDWSYSGAFAPGNQINAAYDGARTVDSWSNSNLQFGLRARNGWSAKLRIRNLFDQKQVYFVSERLNRRGEFFGTDIYTNLSSVARPREVTLAFQKQFN